jgi:hypothetical protein
MCKSNRKRNRQGKSKGKCRAAQIANMEHGRRPKQYPENKENKSQESRAKGSRRDAEDAESQVNVNADVNASQNDSIAGQERDCSACF